MSSIPPDDGNFVNYEFPYEFGVPGINFQEIASPLGTVTESSPPAAVSLEDTQSNDPPTGKHPAKKKQRICKAPDAPKRFKSSYICFFLAKQAEIKAEIGPSANVSSISKRSAELWRTLSDTERAHWDGVADQDKVRYNLEKAAYTGPWQVPWKRAKKDPTAPKRPMSAFLNYSQDKRPAVKAANPLLKNTEISRLLGEMWRQLPEEEQAPYKSKERAARGVYKAAMDAWKKDNAARQELQQKQMTEQAAEAQSNLFADPFLIGQDPVVVNSYLMQQGLGHHHHHHQQGGNHPSFRIGPPPSLPTTGTPILLGPNGLPLPTSQQQVPVAPPRVFDEPLDFPNGADGEAL